MIITSPASRFPLCVFHNVDVRTSSQFSQSISSSQCAQVLPCLYSHCSCMGFPRLISTHLASMEDFWLANP